MGKYDEFVVMKNQNDDLLRHLFWIANELAEANRYKRLELEVLRTTDRKAKVFREEIKDEV